MALIVVHRAGYPVLNYVSSFTHANKILSYDDIHIDLERLQKGDKQEIKKQLLTIAIKIIDKRFIVFSFLLSKQLNRGRGIVN